MIINDFKNKLSFLITLLFIYVMLFEFILPVNKVLPKPSLLLESLISSWSDYSLLSALTITTTIVYLSLLIGYLLMIFIAKYFLTYFITYKDLANTFKLFRFITPFFAAVIFVFWFNNSIIAEFIFSFIVVAGLLKFGIFNELQNIKEEYYLVAKNLGLKDKVIYNKVINKLIEPSLFGLVDKIHYYLWTIILVYEFIGGNNGLGKVYFKALTFNDFYALFSITIIISLLIYLGHLLIKFIHEKYYFWEV